MAERSNAHDSKSCDAGMYPRVQIPFSAPKLRFYTRKMYKTVFLYIFLCEHLHKNAFRGRFGEQFGEQTYSSRRQV